MLKIRNISYSVSVAKKSSEPVILLDDISLQLKQGVRLAVMGESGCGKTTLLNYIYGLVDYKKGEVIWNNQKLSGAQDHLIPGHTMMKYVPQEFDLMPFTTVFENVGEYLSIQQEGREQRIAELLEVVDLVNFSSRKVKTLSGGQKQRVAIAKALAQEPQLLLLDEPFSHIDNFRKNDLRRSLFSYLQKQNISCILATHDKEDVLSFTDDTLIMRHGKIVDYRSTKNVYSKPKNVYCASLFDEVTQLEGSLFGKEGKLILYPHQLVVADKGIQVTVDRSFYTGRDFLVQGKMDITPVFFRSDQSFENKSVVLLKMND
ncbi:MAG: ABC transporter ATP-binding protein [Nonlabens sp.]